MISFCFMSLFLLTCENRTRIRSEEKLLVKVFCFLGVLKVYVRKVDAYI